MFDRDLASLVIQKIADVLKWQVTFAKTRNVKGCIPRLEYTPRPPNHYSRNHKAGKQQSSKKYTHDQAHHQASHANQEWTRKGLVSWVINSIICMRPIYPRLHRLIIHFNHFNHKDHKSNSTGCKTSNFKTLFQLNWWRIKSLVATTSMARNAIEVLIWQMARLPCNGFIPWVPCFLCFVLAATIHYSWIQGVYFTWNKMQQKFLLGHLSEEHLWDQIRGRKHRAETRTTILRYSCDSCVALFNKTFLGYLDYHGVWLHRLKPYCSVKKKASTFLASG